MLAADFAGRTLANNDVYERSRRVRSRAGPPPEIALAEAAR